MDECPAAKVQKEVETHILGFSSADHTLERCKHMCLHLIITGLTTMILTKKRQ